MQKSTLQLFEAQSGYLSAKVQTENGSVFHLHSLVRPEEEWRHFENVDIWGDVIVLAGTGLGYHLVNILPRIPSSARIIVIDYYKELVTLFQKNFLSDLKNETVLISSEDADKEEKFRSGCLNGKYVQVIRHPASYSVNRFFYDSLTCKCKGKNTTSNSTFLILHGKFFLQEELLQAARKNGLKPVPFFYEDVKDLPAYESALSRTIQKERPSFILSVNMLGFDGCGILGDLSDRFGIASAVWFVDDPHPILLHQKQFINNDMSAFCWERAYLPFLKKQGFKTVEYLPLATDPELFSPDKKNSRYANLAFVGSSMGRKFLSSITGKFLWSAEFENMALNVAKLLHVNPAAGIDELVKSVCVSSGFRLPFSDDRNFTWLCSYCLHMASMIRRRNIIKELLTFGIETFGDEHGWKELCGEDLKTHPDIDYRYGLANVYAGIDVNVNITSCQMSSAVNQRVFDIPACGGFVINDFQDDLKHLFDENEIVTYGSTDDLKEKTAFFLKNDKERETISQLARKRILAQHTYSHRLSEIMKKLFSSSN
jgi:spore maturation protein CgeB